MSDRLSSLDTSFLYLEEPTTVMHVGSVMVFDPPADGFDYDRLGTLISRRIAHLPRYRQKVREVPGRLANPVWVDDEDFDLSYHVRRSALPRPGTDAQLEEFVARIQPRPLDRGRPLWEVYLVEGLEHGRFAIVTKTHHALVDGVNALDVAQLLVNAEPGYDADVVDTWRPRRGPSDVQLVTDAVTDAIFMPGQVVDSVRGGLNEAKDVGGRVLSGLGSLVTTVVRGAARPAPTSPLNAEIGHARRFVMVGTDLDDYRKVRTRLGRGAYAEDVSVNDVVLATVAGAFRAWLLTRGEAVHPSSVIRAMVPVSVEPDEASSAHGHRLTACFVDLPVGEPGASMRLHQIAFAMRQQMEGGQAVGAERLVGLAGFAPPTLHSLGARLGSAMSRRLFNVMITNVPGPQATLYVGDSPMLSTYPVMPLARGQALAIGLTSYDGGVYYGLNADRNAMPDVDVLGQSIVEALSELSQGRDAGR
ncbi:MAG: wax ester/triacylglycerol synthase family O-acyltransferase [Actinomycetota bacterium]|nr:wax ester/triacylglycerol synthase family O-acyltransferase [Actinomycetota bacterium]